jgi:hypothetical protein
MSISCSTVINLPGRSPSATIRSRWRAAGTGTARMVGHVARTNDRIVWQPSFHP